MVDWYGIKLVGQVVALVVGLLLAFGFVGYTFEKGQIEDIPDCSPAVSYDQHATTWSTIGLAEDAAEAYVERGWVNVTIHGQGKGFGGDHYRVEASCPLGGGQSAE